MLSRKVLPDVKESIAGLCYVASRCSELPELKILVSQFSLKYGEEYISRVNMLMEHGVKEQVRWIFKLPLYIYIYFFFWIKRLIWFQFQIIWLFLLMKIENLFSLDWY